MDFDHALRVANRFKPGTDLYLIGLFHDAVEDGHFTLDEIPAHFRDAIDALTRRPREPYHTYIVRCKKNPHACIVKIADVEENLARMDAAHETLRPRYENALKVLMG